MYAQFGTENFQQVTFIMKFIENDSCGSLLIEGEIDRVYEVSDNANRIWQDKRQLYNLLIYGAFLPMEREQNQNKIEQTEICDGRTIEYQTAIK